MNQKMKQKTQNLRKTTQSQHHKRSRPYYTNAKHLIFGRKRVSSGKKSSEKSNVRDIFSRCWVWFCVDFYKDTFALRDRACDVVAYYKWAHKFNRRILSQRALAAQLGIALSTLVLILRELVKLGILEKDTRHIADYAHKKKKAFRTIYKFNASCEKPMRNTKIDTLKDQRSLNNRIVPTLSQKFLDFEKSFQQYQDIFPKSGEENLKTSLWNWTVKWGNNLPAARIVEEALSIASSNKWMKQAHYIGFRDSGKSELISKGGQINDYSTYWPKYKHHRLNFLWILRHAEEIVAGKYALLPLSEKASNANEKAKYWKNTSKIIDNHTEYMGDIRPETPVDEWKAIITDKSTCREEASLRLQLLHTHGSYAYENWFANCGWSKEAGKLSHDSAFYRAEIRRKYGLYVSMTTPSSANPHVATNASGEGMVRAYSPKGTPITIPKDQVQALLNDGGKLA